MFIERFFNPIIQNKELVFCNTKKAIEYCIKYGYYMRHYSFKGAQYIKYNDKDIVWNDGSKVDKRKLPKDEGWGKYFSELHNLCSL